MTLHLQVAFEVLQCMPLPPPPLLVVNPHQLTKIPSEIFFFAVPLLVTHNIIPHKYPSMNLKLH